ncbi:MAG TPA: hypothetical protein VH420_06100 [Gaiellaceae bacterium]
MHRKKQRSLKRFLVPATLAAGAVVAASILAAGTAHGAGKRATAAAINVTQTCSHRVQPNTTIEIQAVIANTGDQEIDIPAGGVLGDAGTPLEDNDDFTPTFAGGDTDGDGLLSPGESWTYNGSYQADGEDLTDIVSVEAVSVPDQEPLGDVASCDTDVVETPQPGKIVGISKVQGTILVKEPGTNQFVKVTGATEIPVGSQVDATKGTITLVAGLGAGRTNSSNFYSGQFKITQPKTKNAFMTLILQGGNFRSCGARRLSAYDAAAKSKKPVRKLWGNGKGRFTTKGRYSSATVRGTKWLVQDQCNGTLTVVKRGIVKVKDFRRHKTVNVRAGRSYLAAAP